MGTNIIFRGLWKAENLKLYFHRESAFELFTGSWEERNPETLFCGV